MYEPRTFPDVSRLLCALIWYVGFAFWVEASWATKRAQSLTPADTVTADVRIAGLSVVPLRRRGRVRIDVAEGPLGGQSYHLSSVPYPPLQIGDQLRITYDPLQPGILRRKWLRAALQGNRVLLSWKQGKIVANNEAPAFALIVQLLLLMTFWRFALPLRKRPQDHAAP